MKPECTGLALVTGSFRFVDGYWNILKGFTFYETLLYSDWHSSLFLKRTMVFC